MRVHIVMPSYNHWDLTHARLWELYKHEKDNIDSILIVENGSFDTEVFSGLDWWKKNGMLPINVLYITDNKGFLFASNDGIMEVFSRNPAEDIIILLSNDVQISGKFINQIVK